ncbi:hypothetical protein P154DRAFT_576266 [Amniculicola lignicola CBS 123094]|uniref:SET domain-containing protein n=1 Tax=Amniculicola lignicola CBS 123094 TaxID=1392246 RepID=A0A6A5WEE5_9PLEO|nr:hypothetical protein P154DRAFT_576266 [Amniculicola lignicola CBS 123094]
MLMVDSKASAEGLHTKLNDLVKLQRCLPSQPYSIVLRLKLAKTYKNLGYPDLAIGDAYKALLLVDEIADEGEYYDEALEAVEYNFALAEAGTLSSFEHGTEIAPKNTNNASGEEEERVVTWAKTHCSKIAHDLLIGCLIDCGCFRSAADYNQRALQAFPKADAFEVYKEAITQKLRLYFNSRKEDFDAADMSDYPDKGFVRRELYSWNDHEPDRFSTESIQFLNDEMTKVAPKLEVTVTNLPILSPHKTITGETPVQAAEQHYVKQLGIFAKEDIPPGSIILQEKSMLTAVSRLHEFFCNACSARLPISGVAEADIVTCEDCHDVFFCSADCHDLAQENYHQILCGIDLAHKVSPSEVVDTLYSFLLVRALALSEVRDVHPLDLKEVHYIWGDYHNINVEKAWKANPDGHALDAFGGLPQTLSFSFQANILTPLRMLEKMDVNIFTKSQQYDTWVFNTLFGKFRGTASAQQGLDGLPEIGAVHPMWCLANHSCDPNVAWEWQGSIKFWTRTQEELVDWKGRDSQLEPGIRKGEELLSHYCDVRLPVKERREWAFGALGGNCMCSRCVWEAAEEGHRSHLK